MKTLLQTITILFILISVAYSQSTTIQLPTKDNTNSDFSVTNSDGTNLFKLNADGGFLVEGTSGSIPKDGSGKRMMWYPAKAAFRAGTVSNTEWDDANIGVHSVAMGFSTIASGDISFAVGYAARATATQSTAFGHITLASGIVSTAMGFSTTASGDYSTSLGYGTTASGDYSTSLGYNTTASLDYAIASGRNTTASGVVSTAMGYSTTANGHYSTSLGYSTTASGDKSTAMGSYVSTNGYRGSFIIGDYSGASNDVTTSTVENQMTMMFIGGYRLFSSDDESTGTSLAAGANSWSSVSDSTKKENIIEADGEEFLASISRIKLGSWNYKTQNPKEFRHYGPMAQDIYHYFGNDGVGLVGCDTLLASADMDGIMMIAIKALVKRTEQLKIENAELVALNKKIETENSELKKDNELVVKRLTKLENAINGLIENKTEFVKFSLK